MSSWDHQIRPLTDDERARLAEHDRAWEPRQREWFASRSEPDRGDAYIARWRWNRCRVGKCQQPPTHMTSYRYVTGRRGRTTVTSREVCDDHADKFRRMHLAEDGAS